jgi:cellulose synthase/poly-beta-1,6-N-acetylglucosamine synthase-like glycosyltransferase
MTARANGSRRSADPAIPRGRPAPACYPLSMPASLSATLIVMPAYNEEEAVGQVVREVLDTLPGIACLVVSDGSKDRTVEVAQAAGARVLELPFNLGVGGAMRAGFRYAQRHGFENVIQIDSDGQHNPARATTRSPGRASGRCGS